MHIYLKVKIKNLTAEAQDIRATAYKINPGSRMRKRMERCLQMGSRPSDDGGDRIKLTEAQLARIEKKLKHSRMALHNDRKMAIFSGLNHHRKHVVRQEARSSFIAYGFLRGKEYSTIEKTEKSVDWDRVEALVKKFGEGDIRHLLQRLAEWRANSDMTVAA